MGKEKKNYKIFTINALNHNQGQQCQFKKNKVCFYGTSGFSKVYS